MAPGPSTRAVADFLLSLHAHAQTLGYREAQRWSLAKLSELVPFDGGLFAMGTIRDGVPHGHDVFLHNQSQQLMESWESIKHEDRVALEAIGSPGTTVNHTITDGIFDGCPAAFAHCRAWGLEHVLCTAHIHSEAGLYWVMSMYRSDKSPPFSEGERAAIEACIPHILAASRQARLGQLRAAGAVAESHGQTSAIVNHEGLVLEAEPALVDLLRAGWPRWSGPWLPPDLWQAIRGEPQSRVARGPIVVRADAVEGVRLLHVRRAVAADQLTPREREIAQAFSSGDTYRQIGERLGIAPNTVRRHLANIYEKLGISSKVELDRMVSGI